MEGGPGNGTMLPMSTPTVIESPLRLEPVTADPFIDDPPGLPAGTAVRVVAPVRDHRAARLRRSPDRRCR
jgi:hypothetical protein